MYRVVTVTLLIVFTFTGLAHAVTYEEIKANAAKMTSAQFEQYTESLEGVRINWIGKVLDVRRKFFGKGYVVEIDLDGGPSEIVVKIPYQLAMQFKKGGYYRITGIIERISIRFGNIVVVLYDVMFPDLE